MLWAASGFLFETGAYGLGSVIIGGVILLVVRLTGAGGGATGAPPAPATPLPPPAWHPDPQGQARLRYWDGARWTEHTAD
jgi:hypothetical protein